MRLLTVALFALALTVAGLLYTRHRHEARDNVAQAAALSEALTAELRLARLVAEHARRHGAWPESNAALGLPDPEALGSAQLQSVTVLPEGQIVVALRDFAQVHHAWVRTRPVPESAQRRCETNIPFIARFQTSCQYVAP